MTFTTQYHAGQDVLPWFQAVSETELDHGTRLCSFSDYHTAPEGTRARLGRKNGIGQVMVKHGNAWYPEGLQSPNYTAYGMHGRPSYVESAS